MAPTFWRSDFPGFSRIFRKLEVKAANCRAFRFSILGELDGVTVTQRVEPTAAVKLPSPVTMESFLPGARKGVRKVKKSASGESPVFSAPFDISFIMRTQSTFSRSSSLVLAIRDYSVPRGRSISIGRPLRAAHPFIEFFRA